MPLPSQIAICASTQMLGGSVGNPIPDDALNAIFSPIPEDVARNGGVQYACIFLKNVTNTNTLYNIKVWVETQPDGYRSVKETIQLGIEPTVGSPVQTIPNRSTAPQSVEFFDATASNPIEIGNLPPAGVQAIWLKMTIPPGTKPSPDVRAVLRVEFHYL